MLFLGSNKKAVSVQLLIVSVLLAIVSGYTPVAEIKCETSATEDVLCKKKLFIVTNREKIKETQKVSGLTKVIPIEKEIITYSQKERADDSLDYQYGFNPKGYGDDKDSFDKTCTSNSLKNPCIDAFYTALLEEFKLLKKEVEEYNAKVDKEIVERPKKLSPKVIIYLHGANNDYQDSIDEIFDFRESLMEHGYGYRPIIIGFSWPAAGSIFKYPSDRFSARKPQTVAALAQFLKDVSGKFDESELACIAHSAGSYLLSLGFARHHDNLNSHEIDNIEAEVVCGQTLLLAPDIPVKDIENNGDGKHIITFSSRVHVYYSKHDGILRFSYFLRKVTDFFLRIVGIHDLHNAERLGRDGAKINYSELSKKVVVVNAEKHAKRKVMKKETDIKYRRGKPQASWVHSSYRYHPEIIADIVQVISGCPKQVIPSCSKKIKGRKEHESSVRENHFKLD